MTCPTHPGADGSDHTPLRDSSVPGRRVRGAEELSNAVFLKLRPRPGEVAHRGGASRPLARVHTRVVGTGGGQSRPKGRETK